MITVIIPTYNRHDLLQEAINSVMAQNCKDVEILVGRNGGEKVTVPDDARIRLVEWEDNKWEHHNELFDMARGDHVTTLHDDDFFPWWNSLESRMNHLIDMGSDVMWTDWTQMLNGKMDGNIYKSGPPDIKRILTEDYINTGTMLFKKSIRKKLGYWYDSGLRYNIDWDFKIRCVQNCRCSYLSQVTHVYRKHGDQESERARNFDMAEREIIRKKYGEKGA